MKGIEILYFGQVWQPEWNAWAQLADEVQKVRLKDAAQLAEELEFGLFAYDALIVFTSEKVDRKSCFGTIQSTLTAYTGEKVSETPLAADAGQKGILLRGGKKRIVLVDPAQAGAPVLAAAALSGRPATPAPAPRPAAPAVARPAAKSPAEALSVWDVGPAPKPKQEKKPAAKKWPARAVLGLLIAAIVICSAYYVDYAMEEANSQKVNDEMSVLYHGLADSTAVISTPDPALGGSQDVSQPQAQQVASQPSNTGAASPLPMVNEDRFASLLSVNSDVIGWLQIPGTKVDYAVVQPPDQSFYLTHDIKKDKNSNGNPFLGAESRVDDTGMTANVTIYGHNNKNQTMFGTLGNFKDIDFLRTSPLISFDTLYGDGAYKVVAVMIVATLPSQDNGQFFNFGQGSFANFGDYFAFVSACQARSIVNTGVDVQPGDQLLTLVTCTYEFSNARLAVLARQVRPGESTDGYLANVSVNPTPLYPQAWYDKYGGQKPVV